MQGRQVLMLHRVVALVLLLMAVLLGGCTPNLAPDALNTVKPTAPVTRQVKILAATDRGTGAPATADGGSVRARLRYEEITVSIPPHHKIGEVEWSQGSADDVNASFAVIGTRALDEAEFKRRVAERSRQSDVTGLFVHGYNNSYQDGVFRVAQITADAGKPVTPILFSWPSDATLTGYLADRDAVMYARDDLVHVLGVLGTVPVKGKMVLLAHSMGCQLTLESLRQLRISGKGQVIDRFQVAMAAPDVDIDVFRRHIGDIGRLDPPLTVLAATNDDALALSRSLAFDRAREGNVNVENPKVQELAKKEGIRLIDISSVKSLGPIGHDRFVRFLAVDVDKLDRRAGSGAFDGLRHVGAYVFNAAGTTISRPFVTAGRIIAP